MDAIASRQISDSSQALDTEPCKPGDGAFGNRGGVL
jgi:hypothetical protein